MSASEHSENPMVKKVREAWEEDESACTAEYLAETFGCSVKHVCAVLDKHVAAGHMSFVKPFADSTVYHPTAFMGYLWIPKERR